ncbi:Homeodomain-like domain-containing protein [Nitrosomonas oligotropha]|uniref:Homeodomain-like domain-containing protein n=1 Tax=Nitrosomonas oligotropha TaxID=42354 RepID=A0A2T5I2G1_9PROT|nr:helix-turn-helix domain-containing protein [Nitrosomonas oligotropha]PTQ78024.1 Homeodomain-like domain-containing protein [Nitrosomonas oligotropha]
MNIHKRTRLTLLDRQEIWRLYQTRLWRVVQLAEHFHVSRPTIYDVLKRARLQEFTPRRDMPFAPVGGANLEST